MSDYSYKYAEINDKDEINIVEKKYSIKVKPKSNKKLGVLLVGLGGNNGSTFVTSILAYKNKIKWENKNGEHTVKYYGSVSQYGNINIGYKNNKPYTKEIKDMIDLFNPEDIVVDGWDICGDNLYTACKKNKVIDTDLVEKLKNELIKIKPMSSICYEDFIANNQKERMNNVYNCKTKLEDLFIIKNDIQNFKLKHDLDKVVILWVGSTERFSKKNWLTHKELFDDVYINHKEISPSIIFSIAAIETSCIFLNGSPQNTISPAILELAKISNTFVGGEDLKTGQTKLKSVLVDFLASSGIKPLSIVSYNHLGNNDGKNLDETPQFLSKEITKKNVIDDIVEENPTLFENKKPDHCVVIKYIPSVGDSKRALDEYYSELCLDGRNNIAIHNTCEDSLLAVPLMLDLILFSEFFSRILVREDNEENYKSFKSNLSLLSLFFKAPVEDGSPIINAFFKQRYALENLIKICNRLPINDFLNLHSRI